MEEKIKTLIDNLSNKTESKKANWERVGSSEKFKLKLDNGIIAMDKLKTTQGTLFYQFSISNNKGDTILLLNGVKKDEISPDYENYGILKELHNKIKKAYFKVDETIDGLLGEIEKEGEIGEESEDLPF